MAYFLAEKADSKYIGQLIFRGTYRQACLLCESVLKGELTFQMPVLKIFPKTHNQNGRNAASIKLVIVLMITNMPPLEQGRQKYIYVIFSFL